MTMLRELLMINGNINDFIDKITYGDEVIFTYQGKKFFIQGYRENDVDGKCILYLSQLEPPVDGYFGVYKGGERLYPVNEFLNTPIWNGKTFMDIEKNVEWVDE